MVNDPMDQWGGNGGDEQKLRAGVHRESFNRDLLWELNSNFQDLLEKSIWMDLQSQPVLSLSPNTHMSENLIASFHMDDDALIWFQDASEAGVFRTWKGFGQVVQNWFGSSLYDDPMKSWTKLKQVGAVTSYKTEFEVLFIEMEVFLRKTNLVVFWVF